MLIVRRAVSVCSVCSVVNNPFFVFFVSSW